MACAGFTLLQGQGSFGDHLLQLNLMREQRQFREFALGGVDMRYHQTLIGLRARPHIGQKPALCRRAVAGIFQIEGRHFMVSYCFETGERFRRQVILGGGGAAGGEIIDANTVLQRRRAGIAGGEFAPDGVDAGDDAMLIQHHHTFAERIHDGMKFLVMLPTFVAQIGDDQEAAALSVAVVRGSRQQSWKVTLCFRRQIYAQRPSPARRQQFGHFVPVYRSNERKEGSSDQLVVRQSDQDGKMCVAGQDPARAVERETTLVHRLEQGSVGRVGGTDRSTMGRPLFRFAQRQRSGFTRISQHQEITIR